MMRLMCITEGVTYFGYQKAGLSAIKFHLMRAMHNRKGARFDLVALRWDSTPHARGLRKGYTPKLAIIEMKAGDGAVKDKSGIVEHCEKARRFLGSPEQVDQFREEMMFVFNQKRELGLIKALKNNTHQVTAFDRDIDFMFLFAGHDPSKTGLPKELNAIDGAGCDVKVCIANFMGFGLYKQGVYSLDEFMKRFSYGFNKEKAGLI